MKRALLAVVAVALLLPLASERVGAQTQPLKFFTNFFVTGDYAVAGTSLWRRGEGGLARATIQFPGSTDDPDHVPPGLDIVAAFLYVQTAERIQWSGIHNATVNGSSLGPSLPVPVVDPTGGGQTLFKALNWEQNTRPCWSVGTAGGRRLVTYRADVLRFLPVVEDPESPNKGKFDLSQEIELTVPDYGYAFGDDDELGVENPAITGPRAVGASVVVVYRDPGMPYRGVVIYDGGHTKQAFSSMLLGMGGLYQLAADPQAKLTAIVGDGRPYLSERVRVNGALVATNPFASTDGAKWDNPTFPLSSAIMDLNVPNPQYGELSTFEITPNGLLSDCVSTSAVVMSANVQDSDSDGLLDVWETAGEETPILSDPNNQPLPALGAMGAEPNQQDLFVEIGAMTTAATSYGTVSKPAHSHLPGLEALQLMGDAFAAAPITVGGGTGIRVHFDVGETYPIGTPQQEQYIIRGGGLARGGELIDESITVCTPGANVWECQFSQYPGTVGWKTGFRFLRDQALQVTPAPPLGANLEDYCGVPGYNCTRRFDANRQQSFHYALFAHAVGLPESDKACLDPLGEEADDVDGACVLPNVNNPEFHTPRTNTGIGDFPGGDVLITLGAFDDTTMPTPFPPTGTPFQQAATLMHEAGHNLERRHGGEPLEQNCKPTYWSVMNYLYQLRGLLDNSGIQHLDFARSPVEASINEASLPLHVFQPYRMGYYALLAGSDREDDPPAKLPTKFCNGAEFPEGAAPPVHFRVDTPNVDDDIDWEVGGDPAGPQDVNFNGRIDGAGAFPALPSSDDWNNILLNQVAVRRNIGTIYTRTDSSLDFVGPLSINLGKGDLGKGDLGKGDLGKGDLGKGDLGKGDLGKGDLGKGDLGKGDLGKGDLGKGDLGGGDLFDGIPGTPGGELDLLTYEATGGDPEPTATDDPEGPEDPGAVDYVVDEDHLLEVGDLGADRTGVLLNDSADSIIALLVSPPSHGVLTLNPNGSFVYSPQGNFNGSDSFEYKTSNGTKESAAATVTITINPVADPPVADPQSVSTPEDTAKPIVLTGTAGDGASPLTFSVLSPPANGVLSGTAPNVTYTPNLNFNGSDSLTFKTNDGADSNVATVNITVTAVDDAPVANPQGVTTNEDTALAIVLTGTDAEDAALTYTVVASPTHGGLSGTAPNLTYTPAANYSGADSFTFKVNDGAINSTVATVSITINPVNDAPVANPQGVTTNEDTAKAIVLTGIDADGPSPLTFTVLTPPTNGVLSGTAPNVTYTPNVNYNGPDSFTFKVNDGAADSAVAATVGITVTAVNDAPVAVNNTYTMNQGGTLTIPAPGVLGNDTDAEGSTLTAFLVTGPANCTFTLNANGSFTFTPAANFTGNATFTYKAKDGALFSNVATVTITVATVPYGFVNVKNLPPAAGVTFKPSSYGTLVEFKWQFTKLGSLVASGDAQPSVTITGPGGYNQTFTPANCGSFGFSFNYNSSYKKWEFNWKPKNAAVGIYQVSVKSAKTGQTFGPFPVEFKN